MAYKKGQSGNPGGRAKKGQTITDLIKQKLDRGKFVDQLLTLAYLGDLNAMKMVMNYTDGMPVQPLQHSGAIASYTIDIDAVEDSQ